MKILNSMGLFCFNEGGRWLTISIQPWCWLRIFIGCESLSFRRVFQWGAHDPGWALFRKFNIPYSAWLIMKRNSEAMCDALSVEYSPMYNDASRPVKASPGATSLAENAGNPRNIRIP